MNTPITTRTTITFRSKAKGRKVLSDGDSSRPESPAVSARVPRAARLLALAIRFESLVARGEVADYADLARLGRVTRARMTQIMNLLFLAPDIQEEVLFMESVPKGRERITERSLRTIAMEPDWRKQRRMWAELQSSAAARALSQLP